MSESGTHSTPPTDGAAPRPKSSRRRSGGSNGRRKRMMRGLRGLALALITVFTAGLCFALGAWWTLSLSVRAPEIIVPNVVELDEADAARELRESGLSAKVVGRKIDMFRARGEVLEQFPTAGSSTKAGRAVELILSDGARTGVVPELVGSSLRRAKIAVAKARFALVSSGSAPHPTIAIGRVISQDPPAGTEGVPGQSISVLLSAGAQSRAYVMPDLVGLSAEDTKSRLERVGFESVRVRGQVSGAVIRRQSPRAGHRVSFDSSVVLDAGR